MGGATLGAAIDHAAAELTAAGLVEPRRQARRLVATALRLSATAVFAHPERMLVGAEREKIAAMLRRMTARQPLSRIVGMREFWGLDFLLSAETLDPRPESETLVEAVLARLPDRTPSYRVLDLGTGTGCLLLALLSEYRNAGGIGVDVAAEAARTAQRNAELLGLAPRAAFAVADWCGALSGKFDIIVANPPYVARDDIARLMPEVREYDPHLALDGGADGLMAYRAIAPDLPRLLSAGGVFLAEVGAGQAGEVAGMVAEAGLAIDGIVSDLAGIPRVVAARAGDAQKTIGMEGRAV